MVLMSNHVEVIIFSVVAFIVVIAVYVRVMIGVHVIVFIVVMSAVVIADIVMFSRCAALIAFHFLYVVDGEVRAVYRVYTSSAAYTSSSIFVVVGAVLQLMWLPLPLWSCC